MDTPDGSILPYFKHFSHFAESHESTSSVGLSWKATAKSELFGETQWDVGQGAHQCVALGWNFKNGPDIEFVSEMGYVFDGGKIYGSLGLIWTRE